MKFLIMLIFLYSSLAASSTELLHTVVKNENLMKISLKYFKTRKCWRSILLRNGNMKSDTDLDVGKRIVIPDSSKCNKSKVDKFSQKQILKNNYVENFDYAKIPEKQVEIKPQISEKIILNPVLQKKSFGEKKYFNASFSLSPFMISRVDDEQDISYGGTLTYNKNKKEMYFEYERNIFKSTDSLTKLSIKSGSQHSLLTYDLNKFWGDFTYFALAGYDNKREGDILIIDDRLQIGLLGIKYYFIEYKGNIKDLSISFIPLYEYLVENVPDDPTSLTNEKYHKVITQNIRQSFRIRFKAKFFDKLKVKNILFYRPAYVLKTGKLDFSDALFEQSLKLSYEINDFVDFTYRNTITWDERSAKIQQLPSTDMVHKISFEINKSF